MLYFFSFLFTNTATTEIYTLSLHDALRSTSSRRVTPNAVSGSRASSSSRAPTPRAPSASIRRRRSEEHTSELQSHSDLVCRLLLEKKNKNNSASGKGVTYAQYRQVVHLTN